MTVKHIHTTQFPLTEEGDTVLEAIYVTGRLSQVEEYAEDNYPPEHCQHSYDCCGHYYQHGRADIVVVSPYSEPPMYAIFRTLSLNV